MSAATVTLETASVFFDWPIGKFAGCEVRSFHPVTGPSGAQFRITQWGESTWWVTQFGKAGPRGGPDTGVGFPTREAALAHVTGSAS